MHRLFEVNMKASVALPVFQTPSAPAGNNTCAASVALVDHAGAHVGAERPRRQCSHGAS